MMQIKNNLDFEQLEAVISIEELIIDLAYTNSDFVCTECLRTIRKLFEILTALTGDTHNEVYKEVCNILDRDMI